MSKTGLFPWMLPLLVSSCSSSPLERKEVQETAAQPPIPRSIFLDVSFAEEDLAAHETYGSEEEWERHLADALWEDLHASEMVWCPGEASEEAADLKLKVKVGKPGDPGATAIRGPDAFLNFLGWSALPLVSLWIEDVEIEPAVSLTLEVVLAGDQRPIELPAAQLPLVPTSLSERYPIVSWPTLGSLVLPPFFYRSGDPDHMARAIAPRVRLEAAAAIARALKDHFAGSSASELLRGFRVDGRGRATLVSFEAAADVGRIDYRRNREERPFKREFLRPEEDGGKRIECLVEGPAGTLRLEALSTSGRVAHYTLLLPGKQSRAEDRS